MQQTIPNRIVIYAKDIMNITGRKERDARKLFARIRRNKEEKGIFIPIKEFGEFTDIDEELAHKKLQLKKTLLSYEK